MDFSTPVGSRDEIQRIGPARIPASPHMLKAAMPDVPPTLEQGLLDEVLTALTEEEVEAPFKSFLTRCVELTWLSPEEGDLGRTSFGLSQAEMVRRRRHRLDPGTVRIELHPVLLEDEVLYRRTLAHELFHAAGITDHGDAHDRLTDSIQRSPRLSESRLLQILKQEAEINSELHHAQRTCPSCGQKQAVARPRCQSCNERMA
ncbi:MAG: hypothetical protein CL992_03425 [Euryarchaeota archaeon]|nr:hypothetical protein [Euryarchaeota archaeon]